MSAARVCAYMYKFDFLCNFSFLYETSTATTAKAVAALLRFGQLRRGDFFLLFFRSILWRAKVKGKAASWVREWQRGRGSVGEGDGAEGAAAASGLMTAFDLLCICLTNARVCV